ncbi:outer membrane protein assembly factor BamB family protein [Actinoplanes sichuanensis]|uniref:PQQ-binding-like beta-propeller repeat protein n=1 Tax=Actinoplanes sichuanensis TaxID=512349 RepID=A0ABW4A9S0_9ACTN|nr:PQQ-binding-like beta-propeller repeat protein [Actinoplanes sichuanensis]
MIDLDRVAPQSRPAPPATRALPAALVVVLLALLLGPSAPMPTVRELPQVAATASPSGTWLLTGTTLYSTHARTSGRLDVIAWSLDSGTALWQRDVDWFAGIPALTEIGPALVVSGNEDTRILDVRTGEDRVDPRTYSVARAAGDRIALWDGAAGTLALYDPPADRIRWKTRFTGPPHAVAATSGSLLAVTDSSTTMFALDSGATVYRTDQAVAAGAAPAVRVIDDRVYLLGDNTVTMIDGRRTWTLPLLLPRAITPCGALVCVSGGPGLSAIELLDGHVVWTNRNWIGGEDGIVRTADGRALQIDPGSGVARRDLGYGLPAGDLLIRPDGDRLNVFEWATGQVRGHLPGTTPSGCRRTGRHLACQQTGGQVKVWRLQ